AAALALAGSELVRVTVNNEEAAQAVPEIVARLEDAGVNVPIIGDFHYNGHLLLTKYPECARALAKYRSNPGNVGAKRWVESFRTTVQCAIDNGMPVRTGVNWRWLAQQHLDETMDENARRAGRLGAKPVMIEATVQSAPRSPELAEEVGLGHHR